MKRTRIRIFSTLLFVILIFLIWILFNNMLKARLKIVSLELNKFEQDEQIKELKLTNTLHSTILDLQDEKIKIQDTIIDEYISNKIYLGEYTITAYCSCEKCCGKWATYRQKDINGVELVYGASGNLLKPGISVASTLPFGSILVIDDKEYVVDDRTSDWIAEKYQGKIIDIYFGTHEEALEFAKQIKDVYIKQYVVEGE